MGGNVSLNGRDATSKQVVPVEVINNAAKVRVIESAAGPEGAAVGNKLAVTTTSGATAAITGSLVDIVTDVACFIMIDSSPTAVVDTSYYLPANVIVRFPITTGNKIAAIMSSGTANLYYHPVEQA